MRTQTWILLPIIGLFGLAAGCPEDKPAAQKPAPPAASDLPKNAAVQPTPAPATPPPAGWSRLAPADAGFSVSMPGQPQARKEERKTDNGTVTVATWMAVTPVGAAYSVSLTEMPARVAEVLTPKAEFDDTRNKLLVRVEGKLGSEQNEDQGGHYARTFSIQGKGPKGETLFRVRLVRAGNRTYQLMSAHPVQEDFPEDVKTFFGSFRLNNTQ